MAKPKLVLARNTVSGAVAEISERNLAHPHFSKFYVRVDKKKDEVLAAPYTIEDGERVPLESDAPTKTAKEAKA